VDPFAEPLLGGEPAEQRDELLALCRLETAAELPLVLEADLHDLAEQPPAVAGEVQGPHATIPGVGPSPEQAALLQGVDQRDHPARRDLQRLAERLLGPALGDGDVPEQQDVARVEAEGSQPALPQARGVVAELGEQIGVGYGTFWVAWGIAAIVASIALGCVSKVIAIR